MAKELIRMQAPYVLKVGQGLLDQTPYDKIIPQLTQRYSIDKGLLHQGILNVAKALEDLPRLPYLRPGVQSGLADFCYEQAQKAFPSVTDEETSSLLAAIKHMGNSLARYPNWLRYLNFNKNLIHSDSYDDQGEWRSTTILKNRTTQPGPRMQMDAALSYPYWAYLHQVRVGVIGINERDTSVLTDVQVTAEMEGHNQRPKTLGEREWILVAAPKIPVILPNKAETLDGYKKKFMEGLGQTEPSDGSVHPTIARHFKSAKIPG